MKVIASGDLFFGKFAPLENVKVRCPHCNCLYQMERSDYESKDGARFTSDILKPGYAKVYSKCPECEKSVTSGFFIGEPGGDGWDEEEDS